jgi:hypothetical protein
MPSDSLARNEALYRAVNERIEAVSQTVPGNEPIEFLCECDRADCRDNVTLTRTEYEAVRAVPTHFIVLPNHQDARIEHIALANDRFLVIEKEGKAALRAEASDPRDHR